MGGMARRSSVRFRPFQIGPMAHCPNTDDPYFFSRDICIHFGAKLGVEIFILKQADFSNIIFSEKAMLGRYKTTFFAIYIGVAPTFRRKMLDESRF